ncbi:hypothetical protein QJQ45_011818 [Haematococcus lacustris]|nr:hypothetical protein QJQ45_011818 [Haematococcus lacustris]
MFTTYHYSQLQDDLEPLTETEQELCRKAFSLFDKDGSGCIDIGELRDALTALGQKPTQEELFLMISLVDEDGSQQIDLPEFMRSIQINKMLSKQADSEHETAVPDPPAPAFHPQADKTGSVQAERLKNIIKEFELTLDVDGMIKEEDVDASGYLDYKEFRRLLA